jgi:hypothetical protein
MTDKEALTLILAAATEYWSQNVPANQDLKSALQKVEGALGYFKKPKAEAQWPFCSCVAWPWATARSDVC